VAKGEDPRARKPAVTTPLSEPLRGAQQWPRQPDVRLDDRAPSGTALRVFGPATTEEAMTFSNARLGACVAPDHGTFALGAQFGTSKANWSSGFPLTRFGRARS